MSESAPPSTDPVYSGEVPVVLKFPEREDRHTSLTIEMVYGMTQPRNQKVLQIQLTDESDSYLLYTLDISEDEFHAIKTEQSILVDFPTFPSKLVELLRQCQAAALSEDHPRFVASLSCLCGTPMFTITESNPFRQLAHLSLRFVAGNDAAIKRYLAGRLADFKAELATVSDDLAQRTRQLQARKPPPPPPQGSHGGRPVRGRAAGRPGGSGLTCACASRGRRRRRWRRSRATSCARGTRSTCAR